MATMAWQGATESKGLPRTEYRYDVKLTKRTQTTVHVWVGVRVRMTNYSSFFSYAIGHHCKVVTSKQEIEQAVYIKNDRHMWGHQWAGSYSEWQSGQLVDWTYGSYEYNGKAWHPQDKWCTVFDGDIKLAPDETKVKVIPCINRPPIVNGAWDPIEKTCWEGQTGIWHPFHGNAHWGGYYAYRTCPEDAAFLNNRNYARLADDPRLTCGPAPAPAKVTGITVNPKLIDVSAAEKTRINVRWASASGAVKYQVEEFRFKTYNDYVNNKPLNPKGKVLGTVTSTSFSYQPKAEYKINGTPAFIGGERIMIGIRSINSSGVYAARSNAPESNIVVYHENRAESPYSAYIVGRHARSMGGNALFYQGINGLSMHAYDGKKGLNEVAAFGENEKVRLYYWGNWYQGSYPYIRLQLVRVADGKLVIEWRQKDAKKTGDEVLGNGWEYIEFKMLPQRPKDSKGSYKVEKFEIRAYDKFGREVKSSNTGGRHVNGRYRFDVKYYGDAIWVKTGERWWRGLTFVYSGGKWREASKLHVLTRN